MLCFNPGSDLGGNVGKKSVSQSVRGWFKTAKEVEERSMTDAFPMAKAVRDPRRLQSASMRVVELKPREFFLSRGRTGDRGSVGGGWPIPLRGGYAPEQPL